MSNLVLSSQNAVDSVVNFYGSVGDTNYPLSNLATSRFSQPWRYTPGTNADGNTARFAFSLPLVLGANHVAFCRHNLSQSGQIRVRAGTARFDADLTTDNPFTHDVTFGGGTNGTRTNEYGVMLTGQTCPRYEHDRRYFDNGLVYSEDLSQSAYWNLFPAGKIYADGTTVDFPASGAHMYQLLPQQFYVDTYEVKAQVRLVSGNGDFRFRLFASGGYTASSILTATSSWQWFTATITLSAVGGGSDNCSFYKETAAGVLQFRKLQLYRGASSNGKYRKTTSQRRYQRLGVITEAGATNGLLQSADMSNAAWLKSTTTVTTNIAVAPDGTTSMDRLTMTGGSSFTVQDQTLGGTTTRAGSMIFRLGGGITQLDFYVQWYSGGASDACACRFNPSTGAFLLAGNLSGSPSIKAAGVKDLGGGFYRAYIIATGVDPANTTHRCGVTNPNVNGYIDVWGFQNEANFVTTYIPTTSAAVTRTVDTGVVEPTSWVPYALNASEGTLYHEVLPDDVPGGASGTVTVAAMYKGASGIFFNDVISRMNYVAGVGYQVNAGAWSGGSNLWLSTSTTVPANAVFRAAIRYRGGDFQNALNGALISSSAASVPANLTVIDFMREPTCTAYVRRITLWPTGKSNADLQALTTSGPSAIGYDSGWSDVMQAQLQGDIPTTWGYDYDVIKTFSTRAVEWVRVELYDPAKVSSSFPFEIGRVFMGKVTLQPARNAEFGLTDAWIERSTFVEAIDGRKSFTERARIREVTFSLPFVTAAEGAVLHEIQGSGGTSKEVLYLPDLSDEAACQRFGFVGLLQQIDPLRYPLFATRSMAFQVRKKR